MIAVRGLADDDRPWMVATLQAAWGAVEVARLGELIDASALPGLVVWDGDTRVGLLNYAVSGSECEVVSIIATEPGVGGGRALMDAVADHARRQGCERLWLTTTNNNARAQRFYDRWGMRVTRVHHGGVAASRAVKPSIPYVDVDGTPIVDEIEYEFLV